MTKPGDKATAQLPPIIGQGCVQRFDPEALNDELGADFSAAALYWQRRQLETRADAPDIEDVRLPAPDCPA